jgi:esterase/lipase superfamily enzyme
VDRDLFGQLSKSIRAKGGGFTLYASRGDWALRLSEWLWGEARAGYIGKDTPLIAPGVDTIDPQASSPSTTTSRSNPILVADMRRILQSGARPPDKRTKAFERVDSRPAATGDHRSLQAAE